MPQVRVEKSQAGEAEVENELVHLVRRLHFELLLNLLPDSVQNTIAVEDVEQRKRVEDGDEVSVGLRSRTSGCEAAFGSEAGPRQL